MEENSQFEVKPLSKKMYIIPVVLVVVIVISAAVYFAGVSNTKSPQLNSVKKESFTENGLSISTDLSVIENELNQTLIDEGESEIQKLQAEANSL